MRKINKLQILIPILAIFFITCSNPNGKQNTETQEASVANTNSVSKEQPKSINHLILSVSEQEKVMNFYMSKLEEFAPTGLNCSGDLTDLALGFGKKAENIFLDQFPMSESDEEKYGEEMHKSIIKEFKLIDSDPRHNKIQRILDKMLPFRERKGINYNIHLIQHNMVNAFAIVGGHLYVTTGIMDFVDSEAELASIIGHEIGHVDKKHCVRKIQKLVIANNVLGDAGTMAANFQMVLSAPFGQTDEYESDKVGAYFAKKAGYNPRASLNFWRKMKKNETYDLFSKMTRTHPYSEQREKCLEDYISNELE